MSQHDEIKPEYKTIRISASNYYKLVELTGLLSAVLGYNFSITDMVDLLVNESYKTSYATLTQTLTNPAEVKKQREQFQQGISNLSEIFKGVKIRE